MDASHPAIAAALSKKLTLTVGPPAQVPVVPPAADCTEAEFTRAVIALARASGWKVAHFRPARTRKGWRTPVQGDGKGYADLEFRRRSPAGFFKAELKAGRGRPTPEQAEYAADLRAAGVRVYLWHVKDWPTIVAALA